MAEILKEWLTERLQRPITWETEEFGSMMRNGNVIATVLLSYKVINEEQFYLIQPGNLLLDIKSNWKFLADWLREVEIYLSDVDIENFIEGKGSLLLRLFYQLFLQLDKRDRTNFIKRERKMVSSLVEKLDKRFKVDKVPEIEKSEVEYLSKPLLDERHFIEWQRKKVDEVRESYKYIRHMYGKKLMKLDESKTPLKYEVSQQKNQLFKEKAEMDKFSLKYPCKFHNYSYEELVALEEQAEQRKKSLGNSDWVASYLNNLHSKLSKKTDSEEFQTQIRNVISGSLWDQTMGEEETAFDSELAKKVMKLSQIEKQMCTKIMETKQQARNMVQNRIRAENEFVTQRTQQFNQYLDNMKEEIQLGVAEIDFEKQRQNKLHKKLYAENIRRLRQRHFELCYETMLALIDFVTRYAHCKRLNGDDPPEYFVHEWKILFFKKQPIFDVLGPMEDLIKEPDLEEVEPEEDEIKRLELYRQEVLNEAEFNEYHNYTDSWSLDILIPNFEPESEERKYEYLGTRILGHVVYTLLGIKYPYPPTQPPADLPQFPAKALLCGLPDRSICIPLQNLLNHRKIHVVRLENAINFCLGRFKTEMIGCTDIDLAYDKFINLAKEENNKELIKLMKNENGIRVKSTENIINIIGPIPPNAKQTQTPITLPEEDITLSSAANLGKYAYEALNFGDHITDHLLAAIIVDYIKDQKDIDGFVIINYPTSYHEAKILEETFSGRSPPDEEELDDVDEICLEESIANHTKKEPDIYKKDRISKLVTNPHKKELEKPFSSYFTCYIKLKESEDILQETFVWVLDKENSEFIDRFYAALGINYSLYYEVIDKEILASICKYIIGDLVVPSKGTDELFGKHVLSLLGFFTLEDKRMKTKLIKPEVSLTNKSKDKLKRNSNESNNSFTQQSDDKVSDNELIVVSEVGLVEEENINKSLMSAEQIIILAGEEDWEYGQIPINKTIGVALASCWEQTEKTYIHDLQQLFFSKRLQMNCLIPYTRFLKDKMEQIITLPSPKQNIVSSFQKSYNDYEDDWREVNLTKNEWHCRIKDLQNKLYKICDERKQFAEKQRQALILENWAMEELTTMVNTFISCMQTELNRSMLTYQILHDFYFAMIKRLPPHERLSSKDLIKITRDYEDGSDKKNVEDKVFKQLKLSYLDLHLKNILIDFSNNPFNLILENNAKSALKEIKDKNDFYRLLISKEYTEIAKTSMPTKKKDENISDEISEEEIFKNNATQCITEWIMGVNGEMYRASLRILALQYKCYHDMKLFNDHIYKAFIDIQDNINTYYMNEIKSVDRLCKYMHMAVEEGRKIPETLLLEHDTFVIDANLLQFPPPEPPADTDEVEESSTEFDFGQLTRLRKQFKTIAPTGLALQKAFIYILQDLIYFGRESCEGPLLPDNWLKVDPEQVPKLVYLLFGETAYIDWKDFLIYCLNVRFPTVNELLDLRHRLRCQDRDSTERINHDTFIHEYFWFEHDFDPADKLHKLRISNIKEFLFQLYEISPGVMNYSAFLLAFCKNINPIEGFTTALSMAVGKQTCFILEDCKEVVCKQIEIKQYKDASLACAHKCADEFLDSLIENVVNLCDGTTITEIEYTESDEKDGKGKKKAKKSASQSARVLKEPTKSVTKNRSSSAVDVKATYICSPCENDQTIAEKSLEEKAEEEVSNESIYEYSNLAYTVSQVAIWKTLRICLPWHFQLMPEQKAVPYTEEVKKVLNRLEIDTDNGDIYVCRFVTDPVICKMLHKVKKFTALNLVAVVRKVSS